MKEKRKRSRVTPDQLVQLERIFVADRSPTAARRREISELLGMQERQTQIWFQNRYALLLLRPLFFPLIYPLEDVPRQSFKRARLPSPSLKFLPQSLLRSLPVMSSICIP